MLKNMLRGRLNDNILRKVGNPSYIWSSPRFEPEEYIKKCRKLFSIMNYLPSGTRSIILLRKVAKLSYI